MTPLRDELRDVRRVPLWVAVRWLVACVVRGPVYAERFIRPEDRR
jgi:hypothetical protein